MKKKVFTIVSIVLVAVLYYFSISGLKGAENTVSAVSSVTRDTFTNCIFNSEYSEVVSWNRPELDITQNIGRYKELNFNSIHLYDAAGSNKYGIPDGNLSSNQISDFIGVLNSVKYGSLYGFFERSFLSKYCYGQRLIYEVSPTDNDTILNSGFVYKNRMDNTYGNDQGRTVLHATPGVQVSGYFCKNIYENLQHSDLFDFRQNDKGTWYIKPVMRIPTGMTKGIPVVRIEIIPFGGGVPVKQITINTEDFNDIAPYDGSYKEIYTAVQPSLTISGGINSSDLNYGRGSDANWSQWDVNCKVDFRVFWYGTCEVWFDKMIVDDETANKLFDPILQTDINLRIKDEVQNFSDYGSLYSFFTDEVCISQYPCIQYVAKKMREYNSNSRLSIAVTNYLHTHGLKNGTLDYRIYLDSIKPNFLQADHHGFYTDKINNGIKIPNVLSVRDNKIPPEWFTTPADYNNVLQNYIFGSGIEAPVPHSSGSLIFEIKKTRESINAYSPDTKFIMQPQIHGFIYPDTNTGFYDNGLREPTNEEIQAQAMLSIAHGANGLCWFIYNSHRWISDNGSIKGYMLGLLDPDNSTSKRTNNCYGQNKWAYVSAMNGKILNWLPVLENTNWFAGYSVHNQEANHNYITDIKSIFRNAQYPYSFSESNIDVMKYWELGYFNPKNASEISKYFIVVNRRCIPEIQEGKGDLRQLKIKFNVAELAGYNSWTIKDVNTGKEITFDKNNQGADGYLNLGNNPGDIGYFLPGEGKLFKLIPA